jgi:quinol monooxygenase YgiN
MVLDGTLGAMPGVRLVIQFTADSPEIADKAIASAVERCRKASQEPGCLQFEVFRSALRPEHYVLLELWDSPESLAVHAAGMSPNPQPTPGIQRAREDYEHKITSSS